MRGWLAPIIVGLLSLLLYGSSLDRPPHNDELYHMLAAQGLLETGEPSIGEEGRYWRGYPLTWIVAQSIDFFGPTLAAGRLPPAIFMSGLVVLLFLFLRREADSSSAWLGAGLFAVSPFAIDMAQFVRFYSLQGLVFFAATWIVYDLTGRAWAWRARHWLLAACAISLFGFAAYLQITTLLGIIGVAVWATSFILLSWLARSPRSRRDKTMVVVGLAVLGLVVTALLAATGVLARFWEDFRFAPVFNQTNVDRFWFYHAWYVLFYPTLWSMVGIIAVFALLHRIRPAGFALTIFAIGFLLNSFAGSKSLRYIFYAQPWLFALWGMGLASIVTWLRASTLPSALERRLSEQLSLLAEGWRRWVAQAVLVAALVFVILANPAWLRSVTLLAGITVPPEQPPTVWPAAEPVLQPWLDTVEVVVVGEELGPLFYYGRADVLLNRSKFLELPEGQQVPFAPDHRTDVPAIADAASLRRVLDCHASGLFIIERIFWGPGARMRDPEVEDLLTRHAVRLELPPASRLIAFVWTTPESRARPASCQDLPTVTSRAARGAEP